MIHFTCDACCRPINADEETRYVVRVEVYAALDDESEPVAEENDNLQEIDDLLERLADLDEAQLEEEVYRQVRYDLCPECRKKFLLNPLGMGDSVRLGFSQN